ncbi:unnamed protein product [Peronospora belbahrii]|uniref:Uncharacterized protein n=1 Tax=Peronospora belbahrii TaxID=622444 RepID=A0AAU9L4L8_9STRA|nr:unnamed protein product [Peronospora belbahrii]CAH0515813.1 unnamed protein product [Peronospora belbahrii]
MTSSNPVSAFIASLMAPKSKGEEDAMTHISSVANDAKWRLEDNMPTHKRAGFHRNDQYTSPEGFPEFPRQYIVTTHSKGQNYATYAANSYASAIAIQEEMKTRPF